MYRLGVGLPLPRRTAAATGDGVVPMLPSDLGAALAYHFKGDAGITSSSLARFPYTPAGSSGILSCPSNAGLQMTNTSWSGEGWFMVDSIAVTMTLVSKNATGANEWSVFISATTGVLGFITIFAAAPNFHIVSTANAVTAGVPFHAAWGCDGTNQWVRLNGGTRATTAHNTTTHALTATAAALKIGVNDTNTDVLLGGAGNIGLWKGTSISDANIVSLRNGGVGVDYSALAGLGLTTNLAGYWRMNEKDGNRLDSHGTNHFTNTQRCQVFNSGTIVPKAVTDGDPITQWADQSANTRHLTATTSATNLYNDFRPLYKSSGLNGLPTIRFPGREQTVRWVGTLAQPLHHFVLVKPHNWNVNAFILDGNTENAMGLKGVTSAPTVGMNAGSVGPTASLPLKQWSIVEACFNGASSFIRVNGGAKTTVNAGTATTGGLWLALDGGNDLGSDYSKHPDVEFAELFTANTPQSDADATKLRRYLTNKYAGGSEGAFWPAWNPDKVFVMDGSSVNAGFAAGVGRSVSAYTLATLGAAWDFVDLTYGGKTQALCRAEFASRGTWAYNASRTKNVWCTFTPGDQLVDAAGQTAQQAWDSYALHLAELRAVGWKVIASTPVPFLTAIVGAGYEAKRQSFATIARATPSAYDALCDIAADPDIGAASGGETPSADSLWRDSDRTHWSVHGSPKLAALYATAIASV